MCKVIYKIKKMYIQSDLLLCTYTNTIVRWSLQFSFKKLCVFSLIYVPVML